MVKGTRKVTLVSRTQKGRSRTRVSTLYKKHAVVMDRVVSQERVDRVDLPLFPGGKGGKVRALRGADLFAFQTLPCCRSACRGPSPARRRPPSKLSSSRRIRITDHAHQQTSPAPRGCLPPLRTSSTAQAGSSLVRVTYTVQIEM